MLLSTQQHSNTATTTIKSITIKSWAFYTWMCMQCACVYLLFIVRTNQRMKQARRRVSIFVSFIVIKMSNFCLDFDNTEAAFSSLMIIIEMCIEKKTTCEFQTNLFIPRLLFGFFFLVGSFHSCSSVLHLFLSHSLVFFCSNWKLIDKLDFGATIFHKYVLWMILRSEQKKLHRIKCQNINDCHTANELLAKRFIATSLHLITYTIQISFDAKIHKIKVISIMK